VFFFFLYVFCFISTFSFSSLICVLQHLLVIHVLLFSLRLDQLFLPVYYLLFLFIFLLQKPRDTLVMFQLEAEEGQDLKLHKHTKNWIVRRATRDIFWVSFRPFIWHRILDIFLRVRRFIFLLVSSYVHRSFCFWLK
jgi:hypothetical protein